MKRKKMSSTRSAVRPQRRSRSQPTQTVVGSRSGPWIGFAASGPQGPQGRIDCVRTLRSQAAKPIAGVLAAPKDPSGVRPDRLRR
jgi:hypothetical protein